MQLEKFNVYNEIIQQPDLWRKVYKDLSLIKEDVAEFIAKSVGENGEVVFTGAGSSFFVGEMVAGIFQKETGYSSKAVSSTEILTHPDHYIATGKPVLLVSFARSGNSPESVAAAKTAQVINPDLSHLIITCNKDGELAKTNKLINKFVILLPEEANDKALAMTSSVSSMALVAILLAHITDFEAQEKQIELAAISGYKVIDKYEPHLAVLASKDFSRAVFLGSGPFYGLAREAHLKVQEMTDGQLICKFDSFLGFRHGPRAVVNDETLVVYFHSSDEYIRKYELDLVNSINKEQNPAYTLGICEYCDNKSYYSSVIEVAGKKTGIDDAYLMLVYLIPVQLFSVYKSINYDLHPDKPSKSGAIHRVVQGVTIYEYDN